MQNIKHTAKFVQYHASAPGSLMLFGEHAVLHGEPAIVAALDKRIHVAFRLRSDDQVILHSALASDFRISLAGLKKMSLRACKQESAWRFVLTALLLYRKNFEAGFELTVKADFAPTLGFGSSAAVTVATLAVLRQALQKRCAPRALLKQAVQVVQRVQGIASGADCAAAVFGGVVFYRMQSLKVEKIATTLPLSVVYSGSKMATPLVIAKVNALYKKYPQQIGELFLAMGRATLAARVAIKKKRLLELGVLMNLHQEYQHALKVNNKQLQAIIDLLRVQPGIYGAKISGAGLGDAVVALGKLQKPRLDLGAIVGAELIEVAVGYGVS